MLKLQQKLNTQGQNLRGPPPPNQTDKDEIIVKFIISLIGKCGGKDGDANDMQQPKENKVLPSKTSVEEAPPKPSEKNSSTKDAAISNTLEASQQPPKQMSESPVQEQEAKIAASVATVQSPEAISHKMSKSFSMLSPKTVPVPVEAELSHVEVKVNDHEENHVSNKPKSSSLKYSYLEGQRSPDDQKVKRRYNRLFLIQLSKSPLSMKRPDSLPNVEIVLDHPVDRILSFEIIAIETIDFTPGYLKKMKKYRVKYVSRKNLQGQEKGYWIKENQGDKRQYNREFLIQLSKEPLSMKRPDSLPNVEIVLDYTAHRPIIPLYLMSRATLDFTPGILYNSNKHKRPPIEREPIPLEICCVVPGEYVHFDAQLIRVELCKLFKSEIPDEEIYDWIEIHIGCKSNTKTFIRTLTTALIESLLERERGNSYETVENFTRKLKKKAKLLHKYIKFEQDLEVACISALQTLCAQYKHPSGLLRKAFRALHDMEVLIDDSFYEWEKSDDSEDQPGKDVCLTSVKSFLDWLRNLGL